MHFDDLGKTAAIIRRFFHKDDHVNTSSNKFLLGT